MKTLFFTLLVITSIVGFSSCKNRKTSAKMHIVKDSIDVFVTNENMDQIDSTDMIMLYMCPTRTNGIWEIASSVEADGGAIYHIDQFLKDTMVSYVNKNYDTIPQFYRLARIKKRF